MTIVSARFVYPVILPGPPTKVVQSVAHADHPMELVDGFLVLAVAPGRSVRIPMANIASIVTEDTLALEPPRRAGRAGRS
jgi:hypothetical protein